jgi:hypothetical protein
MANVRRAAILAGTPYLLLSDSVDFAERVAPLNPDEAAERRRTKLPEDWKDKPFEHKPLNRIKQSIRLLHLHPGEGDDPIICSIKQVENIMEEPYTAVSYQWGDKTPEKKISILDGGVLTIGPNLFSALKQFRVPVESKVLWIDAICINQDDKEEKIHQIRLMGQIYSCAAAVVTWLGEASEDSDIAMEALEQYSKFRGYYPENPQIDKFSAAQVIALNELFKRGYWNRVWIIQEVAHGGSHSFLVCGNKWVAWECIDWYRTEQERESELLDGTGVGDFAVREYSEEILAASLAREMTMDGACHSHFAQLLHLSRGRQATAPVDKVFGILGLASRDIQEAIIPDYSRPLRETLIEATKVALMESYAEQMNLLCDAGHLNESLPSWVPDWTTPSQHKRLLFSAYNTSAKAGPVFKIDGDVLQVRALMVDCILNACEEVYDGTNWRAIRAMETFATELVIPIYTQGREGPVSVREQNEEQAMLRQLSAMIHPTFREGFWRTLCADIQSNSERPAAEKYGDMLYHILERGDKEPIGSPWDVHITPVMQSFLPCLRERRFFVAEKRQLMGIGPLTLQKDDRIGIVLGASVPFIFRPASDSSYRLLGPAYVHSIMDGQVLRHPGDIRFEHIKII